MTEQYGFTTDDGEALAFTGVRLVHVPIGVHEGAQGDPFLGDPERVSKGDETAIADQAIIDEGKPCREDERVPVGRAN